MRVKMAVLSLVLAPSVLGAQALDGRKVFLETQDGDALHVATLTENAGRYDVELNTDVFSDHFLSMRPFRCIEGSEKTWCHVPYPYEIKRDVSSELTDLEYDFLFVWKGKTEYGIDMWNGVYYEIEPDGDGFRGVMHEMNMDMLAVPPEAGELRPIAEKHLEEADPDSHWLPVLVIR